MTEALLFSTVLNILSNTRDATGGYQVFGPFIDIHVQKRIVFDTHIHISVSDIFLLNVRCAGSHIKVSNG